ncbi:MAG: hypothetical protein JW876_11440 [Candidatus Krumholzibacteriota bacterium]|nr:hypothetical protein [Candidatus Krumholzibacteriota bacterium]
MTKRIAWALLVCSLLAGHARSGTITRTCRFDEPRTERVAGGVLVTIAGCRTIGEPGREALPSRAVRLLLPEGETVSRLSFSAADVRPFGVVPGILHAPAQVPPGRSVAAEIETAAHPLPAWGRLASVQSLAGLRVAFIEIFPCAYDQATGALSSAGAVTVTVETEPAAAAGPAPAPGARLSALRRLAPAIDNPEALPTIAEALPGALGAGETRVPYVIVTSEALAGSFAPLVWLRTKGGLPARVVTVEHIDSTYAGSDIQERIRAFIADAWSSWETEYVLLGGDDEIIPHRGMYVKVGMDVETDLPCDLYYAGLDGDWNADGDAYWGEPGEEDFLPEVLLGRLPVDSPIEVSNALAKLVVYSDYPDPGACTRAFMLGELLWSIDGVDTWGGDYKDEIRDGSDAWGSTNAGLPARFECGTLYERDLGFPWNAFHVVPLLESGVNVVNHVGHSNTLEVMQLRSADVSALGNTPPAMPFVCYSQGCYAAAFDNRDAAGTILAEDCIAEAFLTAPGGAVAFVGNTRLGWDSPGTTCGVSQFFDRQFFDAVFGEGIVGIGAALEDSRLDNLPWISYAAVRYVLYGLVLLGDPAMRIWTDQPATLEVTCMETIDIDQPGLAVEVHSGGIPVEGARVSLWCEEPSICCSNFTDASGYVLLEPSAAATATAILSVTAPNCYSAIDTVEIVNGDLPLPRVVWLAVDDDTTGASNGDGDGIIENGETVAFDIVIENAGSGSLIGAEAILTCSHPQVDILRGNFSIGELPPRTSIIGDDAFVVTVNSPVDDGQSLDFVISVREDERRWDSGYSLVVEAPDLFLEYWALSDTLHGDGDGCIEPWEHLCLHGLWRNNGSDDVVSPVISISFPPDSWMRAVKNTITAPLLPAKGAIVIDGEIELFVREYAPPFAEVTAYLSLSGLNITARVETLSVQLCGDALDANDDESLWTHRALIGTDGWRLTSERSWSGGSSWKCGPEAAPYANMMDAVLVSPPLCLHENSVLAFHHRIEAEAGAMYPYWAEDAGVVEISDDDGRTWTIISPVGNYNARASAANTIFLEPYQRCWSGSFDWIEAFFDLSAWHGPVQLRLRFASNEQYGFEGWYVDDIRVTTEQATGADDVPAATWTTNLLPAFPNPFNPATAISFELAGRTRVTLDLYDVAGRKIRSLFSEIRDAGRHRVSWDGLDDHGRPVASGVYFCRLRAGVYEATGRLVLVR